MNNTKTNGAVKLKIVSGRCSYDLAQRIAFHCGTSLGRVSVYQFNDGEIQPMFEDDISGSKLFIVQSTNPPAENFQELLMLIDAARRASAKSIVAIIPYFGYSRQYKMDRPGIPVTAELHARLLSAAGVNQIITLDLHSDKIESFFEVPIVHLHSIQLFSSYIKTLNLENLTFAANKASGVSLIEKHARLFDTNFVILNKTKPQLNIEQDSITGEVEGWNVILIDDIIDTAHSICQAARIIMDHGAASVRAMVTHPILSGDAYEYIERSDLMEIVVTDSIPLKKCHPKIKVISTAEIFAEVINHLVLTN
jgi:ribose-phosphate pyrophosphokinase